MAGSFTPNLNLYMPELGADFDTWGNNPVGLNGDQQKIDDVFKPDGSGTAVGINVGTGKTLGLAGTITAAATAVMNTVSGAVFNYLSTAFQLKDVVDPTKIVQFDVSGMPAATTSIVKLSGGNVVMGVPIGSLAPYFLPTAPAGWVFVRGLTIGSGLSGATERANDDTIRLFTALWNAGYAVLPSRGASAAADWTANRQVTMPDMRAVAPVGLDTMGSGAARNLIPSLTTLGGMVGEANHTLTTTEMPVHSHAVANHAHGLPGGRLMQGAPSPPSQSWISYGDGSTYSFSSDAVSLSIQNAGSGGAHNVVQPSIGVNYITPL